MDQAELLRYTIEILETQGIDYHEGGSPKHLRDVAGMLQVSGDEIDRSYIAHWAKQLGVMQPWQAVLERLG